MTPPPAGPSSPPSSSSSLSKIPLRSPPKPRLGLPSSPSPVPSEPALLLTIRPSLSLSDIHLDVLSPSSTPVAKLKQQIRERLGPTYSKRRIRLIYQGRILPDGSALSHVVRPPPPPPSASPSSFGGGKSRASTPAQHLNDDDVDSTEDDSDEELLRGNGKGRGVEGATSKPKPPSAKAKGKLPLPPPVRVYINASIGDVLSPSDLAEEAQLAAQKIPASSSSLSPSPVPSRRPPGGLRPSQGVGPAGEGPSTTPAPRGFDRLLTTGFSRSEVSSLRLQFRSIQASRHTADTMPSPDALRSMEDSWIDSNAFAPSATPNPADPDSINGGVGTGAAGGTAGGFEESDEPHRLLDIAIPAMAVGFFFPLGTFGWLTRQEGLWSTKWQFLALVGVFSSLIIGIVRTVAGDA
ncbi:hypothetical protein MKZ38_009826 [Zalerion maritima]|uniref:Ubiquitin-like domain-containing protein n=1 Tax=Zalerion maritima TaxID=339359 RepID=A0AAD5RZJ6_9PEZI|nr:hypothetical protein MKZ38_009826 [Zalerion maritima]